MLKIFPHDSVTFDMGIVLESAYNVKVTCEINGAGMLDFTYPLDEKSKIICENKLVVCDGQAYRIIKTVRNRGGESTLDVHCYHVYDADAPQIHLQNVPDMIGVNPTDVMEAVFAGTKFSLIPDSELQSLGMRRVDSDGFMIDYFSTDKTNPYDVVKSLIENCGKGEIYADNYRIALVERVGHDTNVRLDITKNMQNISVERDITDMVTRLYPYGKDDAHIGSVNGGVQYIESANAAVYGVREGFCDYCDYDEPEKIKNRALWEFDSANDDRIDVPCVNITGSFVDISKLSEWGDNEKLCIGDSVTVIDSGGEIKERVIKLEYYPYQSDSTVISIGRVKKDLFFYLDQMGTLAKRYSKVSTSGGKVKAQSVAGVISSSGLRLESETGALSILSDLIKISEGNILKAQIGNQNGKFVFRVADNSSNTAINIESDGKMSFSGHVSADIVNIGGNVLTAGADGTLTLNGKKLLTEAE